MSHKVEQGLVVRCALCNWPIRAVSSAVLWDDGIAHALCVEVAKDDAALCEICEKPLDGVGVIAKHYEGPVHAHCVSRSSL